MPSADWLIAESSSSSRRIDDDRLIVTTERHAKLAQQRVGLVITLRRRDERDVHPVNRVDHVVVDLGKDHLLLHAEGVIPATIERARAESAEVANTRHGRADEAVEKLPHACAAQR